MDEQADSSATAFGTLVDGIADFVAAGRSASVDPFADAVGLWAALHGLCQLA